MKLVKTLAILALLAAAVPFTPAVEAQEAAAPSAVVEQTVVDAGQIPVGEPIEAEFAIENRGDAPLEITDVHPACGCTVVDFDRTIPPGETGRIRATVDTLSELGPNSKTIRVSTNDPENSQIDLAVSSDVRPFLSLEPGYARYTSFVHDDRDQTISQLLWVDDFQDLQITGFDTPSQWIDVSYREAAEGERSEHGIGRQWRVDVVLSKEAPIGPLANRVVLKTNHPRQKAIEIPITGFVRPMVAVTPPDLNFGPIDPAAPLARGILVRNFGSTPMQIQGLESTVQGLEVAVEPLQEGQQYKLVFTPTGEMAKGPFQGRVEIRTNLPQQPTITVDLRGEVL